MHKIALRTNADIVAYAAPLIGFAPTNSIVVYMLRDHPDHGTYVLRCAICASPKIVEAFFMLPPTGWRRSFRTRLAAATRRSCADVECCRSRGTRP